MNDLSPDADYDDVSEVLNLSDQTFYLIIRITPDELRSLAGVESASWSDRTSIKAGESLGYPVWWQPGLSPSSVSVLVGEDPELWEVAVEIPTDVLLHTVAVLNEVP